MLLQVHLFKTDSTPIFHTRYGGGHINDTYMVLDDTGRLYVIQKINQSVFRNPRAVMENVQAVTAFLRCKVEKLREALCLVPTKTGDDWLIDEAGDCWRMYYFITDSIVLHQARDERDFAESGFAFGYFQRQLADFPAGELHDTIPNFHNTPDRYRIFKEILKADPLGRVKDVQKEIEFVLAREEYANTLMKLLASGDLPLRVTHNDTKLNNVLFDRDTRKAICVIDLDTVMPGLAVNDFGDSIRFGASTGTEDEVDLGKINLSHKLLEAYATGFLSACRESLTRCELEHLRDGAKMMTLECGTRFLTDYIAGDNYFAIKRENHNLDRCRTQFKLVSEMEKSWDAMQKIILGA